MREAYPMGRSAPVAAIVAALVAAVVGVMFQGGCASYTSPGLDAPGVRGQGADSWGMAGAIVTAVDEIRARHPVGTGTGSGADGGFVVNMPKATTRERAMQIIGRLGPGASLPEFGVTPTDPVYHIARVWVRGLRTKVDVVYPRRLADGSAGEGNATVWVRRGPMSWWVERVQYWNPGVIPTPELFVPVGVDAMEDDPGVPASELTEDGASEDAASGDATPTDEASGDGATYREVETEPGG